MKTETLGLAFQAFMIFEGLALWKIEPFTSECLQGSLTGYKEAKQCFWNRLKKEENFLVWKFLLFLLFAILRPLESITRYLFPVFKISPYIWGVTFPFFILVYVICPVREYLPDNFAQKVSLCFLVFIALKAFFYLLRLLFKKLRNYLYLDAPLPEQETVSDFSLKNK